MGGAAGLMTLAVMTRATLGHTGQALTAGPGTVLVYAALVGAVLARFAAGIWPDQAQSLHMVAGAAWILVLRRLCPALWPAAAAPACCQADMRNRLDWLEFTAAYAAFFLTHSLPVRPAVRPHLQRALGRRGFTLVYSALSLPCWAG